jgi:hypothetical protein
MPEQGRSLVERVADWWRKLLRFLHLNGSAGSEEGRDWSEDLFKPLAESLNSRERRILLLFTDGPRTLIGARELAEKFGCGVPLDAARDLPRTNSFCTEYHLPFPLVSRGAGDDAGYSLLWTPELAQKFVRAFDALGKGQTAQQGEPTPTSETKPVDAPATGSTSLDSTNTSATATASP